MSAVALTIEIIAGTSVGRSQAEHDIDIFVVV